MNPNFNVENQYQLYLKRVALTEPGMHPQQRIQLRQAFFGAWGQLLISMRDEVAALPMADATDVLTDMINQVNIYWKAESERHKAQNQ